jgi:signal transduction histidine kinase
MRQFQREHFEQQGMGMGLALAFAFAAVAGGEFTLRRREPGPGMEARLWVPKAGSPANRPGTTG